MFWIRSWTSVLLPAFLRDQVEDFLGTKAKYGDFTIIVLVEITESVQGAFFLSFLSKFTFLSLFHISLVLSTLGALAVTAS